jgi:hypothetical protein
VTVLTETRLTAPEMERVSTALRDASIVDGESGGTLVFRIGPPAMFESLPGPASSAVSINSDDRHPQAFAWESALPWVGLLALLVFVSSGVGLWAWLNRPKLAHDEHQRFADQLRTALQTQEGQNV